MLPENFPGKLLDALQYAAEQHRDQRRKGATHAPYINHPIAVTEILWRVGGIRDEVTLLAAVLHDTLEDTDATAAEITQRFGEEVCAVVLEVTDDKSLPKEERKRLQVLHAAQKSIRARAVKLADKISNLNDITSAPPSDWNKARLNEYVAWAGRVVNGLRGSHPALETAFDQAQQQARQSLDNLSLPR